MVDPEDLQSLSLDDKLLSPPIMKLKSICLLCITNRFKISYTWTKNTVQKIQANRSHNLSIMCNRIMTQTCLFEQFLVIMMLLIITHAYSIYIHFQRFQSSLPATERHVPEQRATIQ